MILDYYNNQTVNFQIVSNDFSRQPNSFFFFSAKEEENRENNEGGKIQTQRIEEAKRGLQIHLIRSLKIGIANEVCGRSRDS